VVVALVAVATASCSNKSSGPSSSTTVVASTTAARTPSTASTDGSEVGTTDAPSTSTETTTPEVATPTLAWTPCGADLECTTLTVPLDYSVAGNDSIDLPVKRHLARKPAQRIGSLLVNPGGPGFGGTSLADAAESIFSPDILDRFDIVGWDPRGTGDSVPAVDCISDYDKFFTLDPTLGGAAGKQQAIDTARAFDDACKAKNGNLLAHISTQDSARDMDLLRRALGEQRISYFGFSYGSELGAAWVTMFPNTVRAAVFDGAADPNADAMQGSIDQAKGFELAFNAFLENCKKKCAFPRGEDPGKAFDALIADIHSHSYPTSPGRPALNLAIAYTAVADAMYSPSLWPALDAALNAARDGDGSKLLAEYDDYYQRKPDGTYGNELEAFVAISCLDDGGPRTVAGVDAYNSEIEKAAPRLAVSFEYGYSCVFWPVPSVKKLAITGKGAGPIIVIGTTNDPATPFESSQNMARALEGGVFVKVVGNGHTGYDQSQCARNVVDNYLVKSKVPKADVQCD
jgi:pimeloyl-ACP methyl ester carboxylesterase